MCGLKAKYGLEIAAVSNEGRELTVYRVLQFKLGTFIDFFISSCFVHYEPDEDITGLRWTSPRCAQSKCLH